MKLRVSDPLALLPYQTGVIFRSSTGDKPADNPSETLNSPQRAVELGTPVPIVFGLFVDNPGTDDDYGGVFVSPGATKVKYIEYPDQNEIRVLLTMVIGEGYIPQPQVRDVYQYTCKRGTAIWAYDKLAGPYFESGTQVVGGTGVNVVLPGGIYGGSDAGTYENLTTLYYRNTYPDTSTTWRNQVHVFIREGMHVTRAIGGTVGPSNNMIDLALYLIRKTARVPELMIDTAAMSVAAWFVDRNGFTWDGVQDQAENLEEWMQRMAGFFLLRVSDKNGKKGFRPLLPIDPANYRINTGTVSWRYGFTEEHIVPGGFQIEYIPLSERKPICAQMMWRQQPPNDIGFVRTTEVRIAGEALDGPYEQYDMTQFCTREDHAVKIGAYQVARRKYITHSLRIQVKPDSYNTILLLGDIVRVQLRRENEPGVVTFHDYLYTVEKINKTQTGVVELDLLHFPIDALGRSPIALYVAGAEGTGYMYELGRNEYNCDDPENTDDDTPVTPTDPGDGNNPDEPDTDVDLPQPGTDVDNPPDDAPVFPPGSGQGGSDTPTNYPPAGSPTSPNPNDPFDGNAPGGNGTFSPSGARPSLPGDDWVFVPPCCPGKVWTYAVDCASFDAGLEYYTLAELDAKGFLIGEVSVEDQNQETGLCNPAEFRVLAEYTGYCLFSVYSCTDPAGPDGLGPILPGALSDKVGAGGATWDPYPGAARYRLWYTPGFGTFLGDFIKIPYVFGITGGDVCVAPREVAAYQNPDTGTIGTIGGVCWGEGIAKTKFTVYALDEDNNIIAELPRVNI